MAGTCGKAGGEHPHLEHGSTAAPAGRRAVKMASSKAVLSQEIGWYTIDALTVADSDMNVTETTSDPVATSDPVDI